jgi:hypothetical protein
MNRNTLRKRLNTRKKRNTLKSSRRLNASKRLNASRRLNVSKRLNASKRLKKRTSKKQSGGAWHKITKAYEKWIKKLVFKSGKGDSAREILNSKIWRSYIVEEADDPMVSFGDLTDEWFTEHALFGEIGSVSQRYGILGDMVDADQTTAEYIVNHYYDMYIEHGYKIKPGKEGEFRELLNSIRSDAIRAALNQLRSKGGVDSFGGLIHSWWGSYLLANFSDSQFEKLAETSSPKKYVDPSVSSW